MKHIEYYIARDGKKFDTFEECKEYEWNLPTTFYIYDIHGNLIEDVIEAVVVKCNTADDAKNFCDRYKKEAKDSGLEPEEYYSAISVIIDRGLYVWDFWQRKYFIIDEILRQSLKNIL